MVPRTERKPKKQQSGSGWQAQKSASTRKLILDAAIRCFLDYGYSHATTTRIAKKAGLSRGAMLHHFPSKLEIVRAAVEFLHEKRNKAFKRSIASIPDGADRVKLAIDAYWRHVTHPLYVAFFELSVAARTDPELEAILSPVQKSFDEAWRETAREVFPEWQNDMEALELALDLTRHVMDGMAVHFLTHKPTERDEKILAYLEDHLRELSPAG